MRATKEPMRTVTTSLRASDYDRLKAIAQRGEQSMAAWVRDVLLEALDDANARTGACLCGHAASEHTSDGCTICRC